jgi:hypothetical protein
MSTYQQIHPHAVTHHTNIDADTKEDNKQLSKFFTEK